MKRVSEPWHLLLLFAAGGALLLFAALSLMWPAGGPGKVLTVLWVFPVSAVMAVSTWFARGQKKAGYWASFAVVEVVALLAAGALTALSYAPGPT